MNFVEESREWRNGEKLMCTRVGCCRNVKEVERERERKERGLRDGCCCNMHEAERKSGK